MRMIKSCGGWKERRTTTILLAFFLWMFHLYCCCCCAAFTTASINRRTRTAITTDIPATLTRLRATATVIPTLTTTDTHSETPPSPHTHDSSNNNNNDDDDGDLLLLDRLQDRAGRIASSFHPNLDFTPPPPFFSNRHVQTILGAFCRSHPDCDYVKASSSSFDSLRAAVQEIRNPQHDNSNRQFWTSRERIVTKDGKDWFHVDCKLLPEDTQQQENKKGIMLILHGLESNSDSRLTIDMARAFQQLGLEIHCLNFRSCSGTINDTLGAYHLGFTDDLLWYLELLQRRRGQPGGTGAPVYLSGFSLGANVLIKALGELQQGAVLGHNIRGAVAFCVPLDCERNAPVLGQNTPVHRHGYTNKLLKTLKQKARESLDKYFAGNVQECLRSGFDYDRAVAARTITDFDGAFIAPIYGFESAADYYRQTSSIYFLDRVAVPLLVLNSEDDPFMDPSVWPLRQTREHGGRAPAKLVRTKRGGHLGFVFHQVGEKEHPPTISWAPREMARFVRHVMIAEKRMQLAQMGFPMER